MALYRCGGGRNTIHLDNIYIAKSTDSTNGGNIYGGFQIDINGHTSISVGSVTTNSTIGSKAVLQGYKNGSWTVIKNFSVSASTQTADISGYDKISLDIYGQVTGSAWGAPFANIANVTIS